MNDAPPDPLVFADVALVLGDARVLDRVTFAVAPGERVAIVGESGTGKSLLPALALGLALPSEGYVALFGEDVATHDADALRQARARCGIAAQGGSLLGELSAEDNLLLAFGTAGGRGAERLRRRIDRPLLDFGLEHLGPRAARDLSTGEQRRLELARAFVRRPALVILDDPLRGAEAGAAALEAQVRRQVTARGTALLLLTQDRALAARLATRVLVLAGGRLSPHEVAHQPAGAEPAP